MTTVDLRPLKSFVVAEHLPRALADVVLVQPDSIMPMQYVDLVKFLLDLLDAIAEGEDI